MISKRRRSRDGGPRVRSGLRDPGLAASIERMQQAGLGPLGWLAPVWRERVGTRGRDLADYVADRVQNDVRTQFAMLHCRTARELQGVQIAFLTDALAAWGAETGRPAMPGRDVASVLKDAARRADSLEREEDDGMALSAAAHPSSHPSARSSATRSRMPSSGR